MFSKDSEVLCLCYSLLSETLLHNFEAPRPPRSLISVFSAQWDCCTLLGIPLPAARSRMQSQAEDQGFASLISLFLRKQNTVLPVVQFFTSFLIIYDERICLDTVTRSWPETEVQLLHFYCTLDKNVNLKTGGRDIHVTTISQNNI